MPFLYPLKPGVIFHIFTSFLSISEQGAIFLGTDTFVLRCRLVTVQYFTRFLQRARADIVIKMLGKNWGPSGWEQKACFRSITKHPRAGGFRSRFSGTVK